MSRSLPPRRRAVPAISHVALAVPNGLVLLLLAATTRLGAETPQRPLPPSARAARNEQRTLDLSDLGRLVFLEHARISPSGDAVAVVASRANLEEDRYDATLLLVDLASGEQRELARGFRGVRTPEWSPSGDRLAFLAADDGGTSQLWVLSMTGGEPRARL